MGKVQYFEEITFLPTSIPFLFFLLSLHVSRDTVCFCLSLLISDLLAYCLEQKKKKFC